jgi:hypothetical protein
MDVQKAGKELGDQTQWIDRCEPQGPNPGPHQNNDELLTFKMSNQHKERRDRFKGF